MRFEFEHVATLLKYGGISFIAGAVNHGFFSEHRSIVTALIGIACYLLGAWLEKRICVSEQRWQDILGIGVLASIGIGFFTGGLQHFPDSPTRSAWVVPLGFVLSLFAWYWMKRGQSIRLQTLLGYTACSLLSVTGASWLAMNYYQHNPHAGHAHYHGEPAVDLQPLVKNTDALNSKVTSNREIVVLVGDQLQITPNKLEARAGETVVIKAHNTGSKVHRLMIGSAKEINSHGGDQHNGHSHHNLVTVHPGETTTLSLTPGKEGKILVACLEPGHLQAGMLTEINIVN